MVEYPLFFTYRDLIVGNGFVAGVSADGRALLSQDEEGYWMYGVNPGAVAGGGKERAEAFHEFRQGYRAVLHDLASEAPSFEAFRDAVGKFFYEVNEPNARDWEAARRAVRNGSVTSDLPKVRDPKETHVNVVLIDTFDPAANALDDEIPEALAA
jgi:hypothetical protein